MIALVAAACLLWQSADLIERLGDDDPAVRDSASAAIRRLGARAIPDLEGALGHPSPEVRGRAADLLERCPEYALRWIMRDSAYPAVRRRWTAVIQAVVWKQPIPREVWNEVGGVQELLAVRARNSDQPRPGGVLLGEMSDCAGQILRTQVWKVGIEGGERELNGGRGIEESVRFRDFLPLVLRAGPDAEAFEEVYGTLLAISSQGRSPGSADWCEEDWQRAVALLVEMRRRPDAPPLEPPTTRAEALKLASRGPILRGIADALGRAFSNRGGGYQETILVVCPRLLREKDGFSELRAVYDLLNRLDEQIGRHFYRPGLLEPAKAALPPREAPVPDRHRSLFGKVRSEPTGDGALRVVREVLDHLGKIQWQEGDAEGTAVFLRAIGTRVAEAATSPAGASGTPR